RTSAPEQRSRRPWRASSPGRPRRSAAVFGSFAWASRHSFLAMSHIAVAMDAVEHVPARLERQHVVDKIAVAMQARVLGHAAIARLDLNRLVKITGGKCQRMKEAVVGFHDPFAN